MSLSPSRVCISATIRGGRVSRSARSVHFAGATKSRRYSAIVIPDFLDWLDHPTLDRDEVRRILDDIEHANSAAHGYGTKVFTQSLEETFREVSAHEPRAEDLETVRGLTRRLAWEE